MGVSAFQQNALIILEGSEYLLLRKISDAGWQLEDTKTKRIVERELAYLLREFADGKLTFVSSGRSTPCSKVPVAVPPEAKLRRMYVLAALKAATRTALDQAITEVWTATKCPAKPPSHWTVYRWKGRYTWIRRENSWRS